MKTILMCAALLLQTQLHSWNFVSCADCCAPDAYHLDIGYAVGDFIGIDKNYGEIDFAYYPETCMKLQPFVELRTYWPTDRTWGTSLGGGVRFWDACRNGAWGVNVYYDYRKGEWDGFHRMGFGLEHLSDRLDYRLNFYLPVGAKSHGGHLHIFDDFLGGFVATCQQREFDFKGVDGEVGTSFGCWWGYELYGAAGLYYYKNHDLKEIFGEQVRLTLFWNKYVSVDIRASYDDTFKGRIQGLLMLSIPIEDFFGFSYRSNYCQNIMRQPVERNGLIFTEKRCCWNWNWND